MSNSNSNGNGKPPDGKPEMTPIGGPISATLKKKWAKPFLEALEETANVSEAARIAGVDHCTPYRDRKRDKAFKKAWEQALERGIATLEIEARRRALHGVERSFHDKDGNVTSTETKYSDSLTMFLLKAHRPKIYRDNITMEMRHSGNVEVRFAGMTVEEKKTEIADRLRGLLSE